MYVLRQKSKRNLNYQKNIHAEPIPIFIASFNEAVTDLEKGILEKDRLEQLVLLAMETLGAIQKDDGDYVRHSHFMNEAMYYLKESLQNYDDEIAQYISFWYALQSLLQTDSRYDQLVAVSLPSPDDKWGDDVWDNTDVATVGIKSELSNKQLRDAYNKAFNSVKKARGGWVMTNPLFSGLSYRELSALYELGLIKYGNNGATYTLTLQGYERPQFFDY